MTTSSELDGITSTAALPTRSPQDILLRKYGKSVKMRIDEPLDYIQGMISSRQAFYEDDLLDELYHRAMPGMRFVDVGANIGNHAVYLAGIADLT